MENAIEIMSATKTQQPRRVSSTFDEGSPDS